VAGFPSFEAELGYAVARGWLSLTLADVAILARYPDVDEARQYAREVRRSVASWRHIRDQLRLRIRELTNTLANADTARNVIMAQAHDINQSQTLDEQEVTAIVDAAISATKERWQPTRKGKRRHA
jgi:uncharacterized coiled-coil DUF342 family protein